MPRRSLDTLGWFNSILVTNFMRLPTLLNKQKKRWILDISRLISIVSTVCTRTDRDWVRKRFFSSFVRYDLQCLLQKYERRDTIKAAMNQIVFCDITRMTPRTSFNRIGFIFRSCPTVLKSNVKFMRMYLLLLVVF